MKFGSASNASFVAPRALLIASGVLLLAVLHAAVVAEDSYSAANRLFAEGRFAEAAEAYEKSLQDGKSDIAPHCRFMLATCLEKMDDFEKAEKQYRLVWQLYPRSEWVDDALLRVATHLGNSRDVNDVKAAKSFLLKLQGICPESPLVPESLCLLGEINIKLNEFEEADKNLTEVLDKYPGSGFATRAHFGLGSIYSDEGYSLRDLDRALNEFSLVLEEDPDSEYAAWACFSMGNIFRMQKKWEAARPYFQTVIERYKGTMSAAAAKPMVVLSQVERDHFLRSRDSFEQLLAMLNQGPKSASISRPAPLPEPRAITKIEIVSEEAYSDENRAIYKGDVKVSVGQMRIFADYVVCEFRGQMVRASGRNTRLEFGREFALACRLLTFDVQKQQGIAMGDVRFVQGSEGVLAMGPNSGPAVKEARRLVFSIKNGKSISLSGQE